MQQTQTADFPCLCGSRKKRKHCCAKDSHVALTFEYLQAVMSLNNRQAKESATVNWQEHRDRVRALIARASSALPARRPLRVAVFGAGNCSDIPLSFLADQFSAVDLFDVDWEAISSAKDGLSEDRRQKVSCVAFDVSGLYTTLVPQLVAALEGRNLPGLFATLSRFYQEGGEPIQPPRRYDLVLSVNVLSQLFVPFMVSLAQASAVAGRLGERHNLDSFIGWVSKIGDDIVPDRHFRFLKHAANKKGKVIVTTDRFFWGYDDGKPTAITMLVKEPEELLDAETQNRLQEQGASLPGTEVDSFYPKYFTSVHKDQWLWRYSDDKVYLVEGHELITAV